MSKLEFTAEDFKRCALPGRSDLRQFIADEANKRLEEMVREQGELVGRLEVRLETGIDATVWSHNLDVKNFTHTGVVVNVERIDGKAWDTYEFRQAEATAHERERIDGK